MLIDRVDEIHYFITIFVGIISWIIIYIGYKSNNFLESIKKTDSRGLFIDLKSLRIFSILSIILYIAINYNVIIDYLFLKNKVNLFENSNGNGIFIILGGIYAFSIYYYASYFVTNKDKIKLSYVDYIIILSIIGIFFFTSVILGTRRNIAIVFFVILLTITIFKEDKKYFIYFLSLSIFSSIFIMSLLQILRSGTTGFIKLFDLPFFYQTIISTFEGHWLSVYLSKISITDFFFGLNIQIPFDNLINYIPRIIWSEKPYNLGIMEIQSYLVPKSFNDIGFPIITLPSTILVEIFYTFGILFGVIAMYYLGKLFRFIDELFKNNNNNVLINFIFIYSYVNMYNFVRSGSAFIIYLIIPIILLMFLSNRSSKKRI
ncbi:O-antigen polymerase [Aliarcobacter butzleri]